MRAPWPHGSAFDCPTLPFLYQTRTILGLSSPLTHRTTNVHILGWRTRRQWAHAESRSRAGRPRESGSRDRDTQGRGPAHEEENKFTKSKRRYDWEGRGDVGLARTANAQGTIRNQLSQPLGELRPRGQKSYDSANGQKTIPVKPGGPVKDLRGGDAASSPSIRNIDTPKQLPKKGSSARRLVEVNEDHATTQNIGFLKQKASVPNISDRDTSSDSTIRHVEYTPKISTITPAERNVFDRILDDISRGITPKRTLSEQEADSIRPSLSQNMSDVPASKPVNTSSEAQAEAQAEAQDILAIFSNALARPEKASQATSRLLHLSSEKRFPPALREMQARAEQFFVKQEKIDQGMKRPHTKECPYHSTGELTDYQSMDVEQARKKEFTRIEKIFYAAIASGDSDLALWRACERMIFPMIGQLGLEPNNSKAGEGPAAKANEGQKRAERRRIEKATKKAKKEANMTEDVIDTPTNEEVKESLEEQIASLIKIPKEIPPLALISSLYPAALLLALRLMHKHSPISPLALLILPTIRSLGPTSYVLGASTPLYNELLSLRWNVYSDLKTMGELLAEMERGGVQFDFQTYSILKNVLFGRLAGLLANNGQEKWWGLSSTRQHYRVLCEEGGWIEIIRDQLAMQGVDVGEPIDREEEPKDIIQHSRRNSTPDGSAATRVEHSSGPPTPPMVWL